MKRKLLLFVVALLLTSCIGSTLLDRAGLLSVSDSTEISAEVTSTPSDSRVTSPPPTTTDESQPNKQEVPEPTPALQAAQTQPSTTPTEPGGLSVTFLDVGQGDSALVSSKGHYLLIDGGTKADSSLIYSVLKRNKIAKLDYVIGTHGHEDHIGGLPGAYRVARVGKTWCSTTSYDSKAFRDFAVAARTSGGIRVPPVGTEVKLGDAKVLIMAVDEGMDENDTSIVLKISYGKTSFLFTGDAETMTESTLVESGYSLRSTVLKVAHHGSSSSTGYQFLREVMPRYAVISCGKGNSYGHPHDETLSKLRDADAQVFRTDLQGDITCVSDGKTVHIKPERNRSADTLAPPGPKVKSTSTIPPGSASSGAKTNTSKASYVLNTNTKKFHYDWCGSVKRMAAHNRKNFTGTRKQVIAQGYVPCKICEP